MENLSEFIRKTEELLAHLESNFPTSDERDTYLVKTNQLLNEREQLLSRLSNLSTLEEAQKSEMIQYETKLQALLKKQQTEIKKNLQLLRLQKNKTVKYQDPYGDISVDGMYLDKKK